MEVNLEKQPSEGEVFIFTTGGGFVVRGNVKDVSQKLSLEDWPVFELAETGDGVVIRSSQVVALRGGTKSRKPTMGFTHRD